MIATYDALHNERCSYEVHESEVPFGHSLGNFKTFVASTPKGGIRGLWDADTDRIIFGTHQIAYRVESAGRTFFPNEIVRTFTFEPAVQLARFDLPHGIDVQERFYVPHGAAHDRTVAFVLEIDVHNAGDAAQELALFPWALLVGQRFYGEPEREVRAEAGPATIAAWNEESGAARTWGGSRFPVAAVVGVREELLRAAIRGGSLRAQSQHEVTPELAEHVRGRIFGAFEYRIALAPGARETLRLVVAYDGGGRAAADARFAALVADAAALPDTRDYYGCMLADARFLTPSPLVSRGVAWARANMLRVVKEYPHGWGSTNSPPSDILVSRDTSWFVHGYDYFLPQFSRDALEVFNRNVEESGQVVEYVRGVSGYRTSYDLNINDDTPLHLVALLHHYNATLDEAWVAGLVPTIVRIAEYLLAQRDGNGLIFCRAEGVDMYGIASWRNIIPYYTLDGAVTEINAEAVFALEAAATLCAVAGDRASWQRYAGEARTLRERTMTHLFNADTGGFVLNYDKAGNYQDDFTADQVFPVLFDVADPAQRRAILARLGESDFATPVGLRTIGTSDAWYFPSHGFGLLGGIWPDLTLWFAVALARNGEPGRCVEWLEKIYASMEAGAARNTVPGQFAEWFDGGSLTNRGMYLSPWTGAKYLWAVAETVGGLDGYRTSGRPYLSPLVPDGWAWVAGIAVRWGSGRCTYVIDVAAKTIYGDMREVSAEDPYHCVYAGLDVTAEITVSPVEVGIVAYEDEGGGVRAFVCNLEDGPRAVEIGFRGTTFHYAADPGGLGRLVLAGTPADADAYPAARL